jgi:hypothetical protein
VQRVHDRVQEFISNCFFKDFFLFRIACSKHQIILIQSVEMKLYYSMIPTIQRVTPYVTPFQILSDFDANLADSWKWVELARLGNGIVFEPWPTTVFIPLDMSFEIVQSLFQAAARKIDVQDLNSHAVLLHTLSGWRLKQTYYQFDQELYHALMQPPAADPRIIVPAGELPEPSIYIETPGLNTPLLDNSMCKLHGVWITKDFSNNDQAERVGFVLNLIGATPAASYLRAGTQLPDAIHEVEIEQAASFRRGESGEWHEGYGESARMLMPKLLALLHFILKYPDHPGLKKYSASANVLIPTTNRLQ